MGDGFYCVWDSSCPLPYCTYEWGWTGMSNLMNVNCLIPKLRSRLLCLKSTKEIESGGMRRDKAKETSWGREERLKTDKCERSGAGETEHGDARKRENERTLRDAWRWWWSIPRRQEDGTSSSTTCFSLSTSCHLIPNPFIQCSLFADYCLNSLQAVVKKWFKSSQSMKRALWVCLPLQRKD